MEIRYIKGIGEKKAQKYKKLNIVTLMDLLNHLPKDYEQRSRPVKIASVKGSKDYEGKALSFVAAIRAKGNTARIKGGLTITTLQIGDGTGFLKCVWYNQPYRASVYKLDKLYYVYGKVSTKHGLTLQNPIIEPYEEDEHDKAKLVPVYPLTAGISHKDILKSMKSALGKLDGLLIDEMPTELRVKYSLCEKNYAYNMIHFPKTQTDIETSKQRFVFEDFFYQACALIHMKKLGKKQKAFAFSYNPESFKRFNSSLPYELTNAQKRVISEIKSDLTSEEPMNRLVQGDVGSGKTVVSAFALILARDSGFQSAFLAPTEILATQHYNTLSKLLPEFNIALLKGKMKASEKREVLAGIKEGTADIVIGTHALLEKDVEFKKLGLVVTDEQHRFGVKQRAEILDKASIPHMLVMSATPIPRTLSLIMYGDLDISIIDELPPGRQAIDTYCVDSSKKQRIYNFIAKHIEEGGQAYLVYPLVEDSEMIDAVSTQSAYDDIRKSVLGRYKTDLLHGKMKGSEKDAVMKGFVEGDTKILVSTTVIEVGVDVPNAGIMVIENAERFGLSQLHQLRGRVGRGTRKSHCILITDHKGELSKERMKIMTETNDGFKIAEKDLSLRGAGQYLGFKQHGTPDFRIGRLPDDLQVFYKARKAAEEVFASDRKQDDWKDFIKYIDDDFKRRIEKVSFN